MMKWLVVRQVICMGVGRMPSLERFMFLSLRLFNQQVFSAGSVGALSLVGRIGLRISQASFAQLFFTMDVGEAGAWGMTHEITCINRPINNKSIWESL